MKLSGTAIFSVRNIKLIISLLLMAVSVSLSYAKPLYVCLGSFKVLSNAQNFVAALRSHNITAAIDTVDVNGTVMHRVLLAERFDSASDAVRRCKEMSRMPFAAEYDIHDIWVTPSDNAPERNVAPPAATAVTTSTTTSTVPATTTTTTTATTTTTTTTTLPVVLQKNNENETPLTDETPYSVKVRSYKEESAAENDRDRLRDKDVDAYILRTYDDHKLFSFDLHAGAFGDKSAAEELAKRLETMGIQDTQIEDYNDIKPKLDRYNEVVSGEEVTLRGGIDDIPTILSPFIRRSLHQFPINRNFTLKELFVYDLDNYRRHDLTSDGICLSEFMLAEGQLYHSYTSALYRDNLLNSDILIQIAAGDPECVSEKYGTLPDKFAIPGDEVSCFIDLTNDFMTLIGTNSDRSIAVTMTSSDFDRDKIISFLNNIDNDSSLLIFPEVRRNLLVLPNVSDKAERDLLRFSLTQVGESYADERGNVDWSMAMVGHWEASGYFMQNDDYCSIAFFDLDYDYNARHVYQMFMQAHSASEVNENSHSTEIFNLPAWYLVMLSVNELSFSKDSHIIAIDSPALDESSLADIAQDLRIWDGVVQADIPSDNNEESGEESAGI